MGACFTETNTKLYDKEVVVFGYCRRHEIQYQTVAIPNGIKVIICEFVSSLRQPISSKIVVSDDHIDILSKMDIIHMPRGKYELGDCKLMIYSDEAIKQRLKEYKRKKPQCGSIIVGELGMGMGFTGLLCYKLPEKQDGTYFYDANLYYRYSVGGMNGYDAESSYKTYNNGEHLEFVKYGNIIDVANNISRSKQMLMGRIPFEDSDDDDDDDQD